MSARRGLPLGATLLTLLMVPVLLGLGVWQLQRRDWKAELIATASAAPKLPPLTPRDFFEAMNGTRSVQYRRALVDCFPGAVKPYDIKGGSSADGDSGFLILVDCGAKPGHKPDIVVVAGWSKRPDLALVTVAQRFDGLIIEHPYGQQPVRPQFMLIPTQAVPPLAPSRRPAPDDLPNNHMSYALQWFSFAAILLAIYALYALRWRQGK